MSYSIVPVQIRVRLRFALAYVRAWLYVRFFIRYEMPGCAVEAKVREGLK